MDKVTLQVTHAYTEQEQPPSQQLTEFQQQRVLDHLELVKWVAHRIIGRFSGLPSHLSSEDLMHCGILGLIDAVKRFSWNKDVEGKKDEFRAYAECRIRGQIMDELRQADILPRSARDKVKQFNKILDALKQHLKREPTDVEMCDFMKIDKETYHRMRAEANFGRQMSLDALASSSSALEGILQKTMQMVDLHSAEAQIHIEEVKHILAQEVDHLEEKERTVVSLYYYDELTLKEIGHVLSITESRVSQIHSKALEKLTRRIKKTFNMDLNPMEEL